jgi:hypothetical protein
LIRAGAITLYREEMKTGTGKYKESYERRAKLMNMLKPYGISRYQLTSLHNPAKGKMRFGEKEHTVPFYVSFDRTNVFKYRGRFYDASRMPASKRSQIIKLMKEGELK